MSRSRGPLLARHYPCLSHSFDYRRKTVELHGRVEAQNACCLKTPFTGQETEARELWVIAFTWVLPRIYGSLNYSSAFYSVAMSLNCDSPCPTAESSNLREDCWFPHGVCWQHWQSVRIAQELLSGAWCGVWSGEGLKMTLYRRLAEKHTGGKASVVRVRLIPFSKAKTQRHSFNRIFWFWHQ